MLRNNESARNNPSTLAKLAGSPLLASALLLTGQANGRGEADRIEPPKDSPLSSSLRLPVSQLYDRERASSKKLLPEIGGVALIDGSAAKELLQELYTSWSRGQAPASEKSAQLLRIASNEPGTMITPTRLRAILDQNPTPDVHLAFLKFCLSSPFMGVSEETLRRFWSSDNTEVIAHALLCKAEEVGRVTPSEFFAPYQSHQNSEVRQACAIAMMAGGHPLPTLSPFDLFQCSTKLSVTHHAAGLEGRIVRALSERLFSQTEIKALGAGLSNHTAALLHLLQRIDQAFPGYLERVNDTGPQYFVELARGLSDLIYHERDSLMARPIMTPDGAGIIALHFESQFTPQPAQSIFEGVGSTRWDVIKAGPLADGSHGVDAATVEPIRDTPFRRDYLKSLDSLRVPDPRASYLNKLASRSKDTTRPLLVIHNMHGGPEHSWFYHGAAGQDDSEKLDTPRAISYRDLADTLFRSAASLGGSIDLSHITIILDACRQYTVAQDTLATIETLAQKEGLTIEGFPTIVALSQPFMYASMNVSSTVVLPSTPEEKRTIPKEGLVFEEHLVSPVTRTLASAAQANKAVTFSDLFTSDINTAEPFFRELEDPRLLLALPPRDGIQKKDAERAKLRMIDGIQNPAIFGPKPIKLREAVQRVIDTLKEVSPELPPLPRSDSPDRPTFLEISASPPITRRFDTTEV